jgi:hypothetical protein
VSQFFLWSLRLWFGRFGHGDLVLGGDGQVCRHGPAFPVTRKTGMTIPFARDDQEYSAPPLSPPKPSLPWWFPKKYPTPSEWPDK